MLDNRFDFRFEFLDGADFYDVLFLFVQVNDKEKTRHSFSHSVQYHACGVKRVKKFKQNEKTPRRACLKPNTNTQI